MSETWETKVGLLSESIVIATVTSAGASTFTPPCGWTEVEPNVFERREGDDTLLLRINYKQQGAPRSPLELGIYD